jgi:glycosyltransferase involved in cell wall biosynthesis
MTWEAVCQRYTDLLEAMQSKPYKPKKRPLPGKPTIHQVLSHLAANDAVGNEALLIRRYLRQRGLASQIYADHLDHRLRRWARPLDRFESEVGNDDIILWHFSTGSRIMDWIKSLGQPTIMRYHNVTPDKFFRRIHHQAAFDARLGRHQLQLASEMVELAVGVSEYNRSELVAAGYKETAVAPFIQDFEAFQPARPGPFSRRFNGGGPNLLHVGRLAPQKRIDQIIKTFYFLKRIEGGARLFIVGGDAGFETYAAGLEKLCNKLNLNDVYFVGQVDHTALTEYYSLADIYLCLSEHEGFCVPLVEAMTADLAVIARAAAAIPETLGEAGLLLAEPHPAQVAEAIALLSHDSDLRQNIIDGQRRRLKELDPSSAFSKLWDLLKPRLAARVLTT